MQAENKKSKKKNKKRKKRSRWRNAECTATASKTFTNLPRFAAMCLILAWPTRVRNYSWVLLRWSNLRRLYHLPRIPLTIHSSSLLHSLSSCFLLSVCLPVFSVAIFVINCLHIFLPFCQFSTTHHVICTDHLTPLSASPSPLYAPVSVLSAAPSNWRPALCHAPHCRLICRVCCCCTCHSLSLLHIYI